MKSNGGLRWVVESFRLRLFRRPLSAILENFKLRATHKTTAVQN